MRSSDFSAIRGFFLAREVVSGGAKTKGTLPKWHGRPVLSPPLIRGPPERQSTTGQISQAAVARRRVLRVFRAHRRLLRPGARVLREVNRDRAADVAPGPVCLLSFVFSPRTWPLLPHKSPTQQCRCGARADFWSATGPLLARSQLRRENNSDETSFSRCAGVGFVPPARRRSPGNNATAPQST